MVKCLRFWVNEPPEKTMHFYEAARALRDAYNAMLREWEIHHREDFVAIREAGGGDLFSAVNRARLNEMRVAVESQARAAAPTLGCAVIQQMKQDTFTRDLKTYWSRRFYEHIPASLRHKADAMVVNVNRSGCGFEVKRIGENIVVAMLPLWRLARGEVRPDAAELNSQWYELVPVDRNDARARERRWTIGLLETAIDLGTVGGAKLVPPRKGAPAGKRRWQLMITVTLPAEGRTDGGPVKGRTAGLDRGLTHFVVYSCPDQKSVRFWNHRQIMTRMDALRKRMSGVPRPKRQKLGNKLSRVQDAACRQFAREVVDQCLRDRVETLRIEDLTGICKAAADDGESRRFALGAKFPYFKLETYLGQYCEQHGIALVKVNPANTSIRCSRCGTIQAANREGKRYVCYTCGADMDADMNAANNIATWAELSTGRKNGRGHKTKPTGCAQPAAPDNAGERQEDAA